MRSPARGLAKQGSGAYLNAKTYAEFWRLKENEFKIEAKISKLQAEAIQRGFAIWISDENGNATFTWKEPTP